MSVEQTNVVDAIGIDRTSGEVVLTIADHLDWSDEHQHFQLLQDKINAYLRFVVSGEILEKYPKARGKRFAFDIVAQYALNEPGARLFEQLRTCVEHAGLRLRFRQLKTPTECSE